MSVFSAKEIDEMPGLLLVMEQNGEINEEQTRLLLEIKKKTSF